MNRLQTTLVCLLTAVWLAACQPAPISQPVADLPEEILPIPQSGELSDRAAEPVLLQSSGSLQPTQVPPAVEEPLRFTFPTPGPDPISLWRAPLYPAPWALSPHDHFYFTRPIAVDEVNWPLADYRYGGVFFGTDIVHTGIDIPSPRGTPVLAAGPGKVIHAGYGLFNRYDNQEEDPYGLAVAIKHDFGWDGRSLYTVYAHMDRVDVINGQRVETGDQVGIIGTTGFTTGPHLHFEVRVETNSFYTTRNPELWITPPQGCGVLVGKLLNTNGSILTHQKVYITSLDTNQRWYVISYGQAAVISDEYYQENLAIGDLPAGRYRITINYMEETYASDVTINPGAVTRFAFRGEQGFQSVPTISPADEAWQPPLP
ncbi:MAG: M23 family metallopeptidase [Chloroflexi bacterium]|nr:M23 family metallopeptidase [Chloroflexota bacterium]